MKNGVCQVMLFAWLPCSLILRQEQGSEKEIAEVNTQKTLWYAMAEVNTHKRPYVRLLSDKWKHILITEFPEQGTHSGNKL